MSKHNTEFQRFIDAVGLTQRQASVFFGRDERTTRRWAKGDKPDHSTMILMDLLRERPELYPVVSDITKRIRQDEHGSNAASKQAKGPQGHT